VDEVPLYDTLAEPLSEEQLEAVWRADYLTFTSSSTVRFFSKGGGRVRDGTRIVSIGPVTSATLREHGLEPAVEASRHDLEGLVQALLDDVAALT
jgi:uroporphyrinogen III methyltransferase/synthase